MNKQVFDIQLQHHLRNIQARSYVVAENEAAAFEVMKEQTLKSVTNFVNSGWQRNTTKFVPAENFWDGVTLTNMGDVKTFIDFRFDRIVEGPFKLS